jgi:uncharacterized RDD family membrane protein YckC
VERLDTVVRIETPERVAFRFRLAGPGARAAALFLDLIVQAMLVILLIVGSATVGSAVGEAALGPLLIGIFMISWFYASVFELALGGRTPGKVALGLRVVRADGSPVRWQDVVLRNLTRGVDGLPFLYGLGAVVAMFDAHHRRIGDLVAGTMVVVEQQTELVSVLRVDPPDERERGILASIRLSRSQRRAIEDLLRRRSRFGEARAEELARPLAARLEDKLDLGDDAAREALIGPVRTLELAWLRATGGPRE